MSIFEKSDVIVAVHAAGLIFLNNPGQPLSRPCLYPLARNSTRRMNFQETEYALNEPWWVTVLGCVTLAALFALALIAV